MADIATVTTKIHALLKSLKNEDRPRAISAAMTLLGESYPAPTGGGQGRQVGSGPQDGDTATARAFFDEKVPKNKLEELAVAARYRELYEDAESNTSDQLKQTFKAARRNFDARHFGRDMGNAKTAKLFNLGKDNSLSHFGQKYVDALPNREQVAALRRPKGGKKKATVKAK